MRTPMILAAMLAMLGTSATTAAAQGFDERGETLDRVVTVPDARTLRYNTNTYNAQRAAARTPPPPSGYNMYSYLPEPTTTTRRTQRPPRICNTTGIDTGFNDRITIRPNC